jgi:hypothetical protein
MSQTLVSRVLGRIAARFRTPSVVQQATFTEIFRSNAWGSAESVSGPGSTAVRGSDFLEELISMLDAWNVRSVVDAPCGDFNWMRHVLAHRDLAYTGVDIVAELIAANASCYTTEMRRFVCADMTRDHLPKADLILCRDGLVHLSFADARAAIRNFRRSGSRYLLATTFVNQSRNLDVATGGWRVLNLQAAPFFFPEPLALIDERCTHSGGQYRDKRLGLWRLA